MNPDDWAPGMTMGRPSALYENSHPPDVTSTWPIGEAYFPSRWVWAHNEFTPRQTLRGKMALYGYLHGLDGAPLPTNPTLTVNRRGTVTSSPAGIDCGSDCTEAYALGTVVNLTASPAIGSIFAGWTGACSGSGTCAVTMDAGRSVTAAFSAQTLSIDDVATVETDSGTTTLSFAVTLESAVP